MPDGRVLIAWDDGPLEPSPTWTRIDYPDATFPDQFVAGYDLTNGRQTLLSQTQTGTATVYINDHERGLFDPRNSSSPFFGNMSGKQILLQLHDPVRDVWEPQFRGLLDSYEYALEDSGINRLGQPINATINLACVDKFDHLGSYGLTPGLNGVKPLNGGADGVYYPQTTDEVFARIIEVLEDVWGVGVNDSIMSVIFSGNVAVQAVKYNPDESAMVALRDAADAEFPFIANLYVDRYGRVVFHGRYARFQPDDVAAGTTTERWNYHRWYLGDGKAIQTDALRTQIRVLEYERARANIVNAAVCYPANMPAAQMPNQVYANTTSITDYGKFAAPPMNDLLTANPINDNLNGHPGWTRYTETLKYAELLVRNQSDPREAITALQLKTVAPTDPRGPNVWAFLTQADVSDVCNVMVGYPYGTGLTGASPADDYFIEGRKMTVRPLQPDYDFVQLDLSVSPCVWSQDTHSVFPAWPGGGYGPT